MANENVARKRTADPFDQDVDDTIRPTLGRTAHPILQAEAASRQPNPQQNGLIYQCITGIYAYDKLRDHVSDRSISSGQDTTKCHLLITPEVLYEMVSGTDPPVFRIRVYIQGKLLAPGWRSSSALCLYGITPPEGLKISSDSPASIPIPSAQRRTAGPSGATQPSTDMARGQPRTAGQMSLDKAAMIKWGKIKNVLARSSLAQPQAQWIEMLMCRILRSLERVHTAPPCQPIRSQPTLTKTAPPYHGIMGLPLTDQPCLDGKSKKWLYKGGSATQGLRDNVQAYAGGRRPYEQQLKQTWDRAYNEARVRYERQLQEMQLKLYIADTKVQRLLGNPEQDVCVHVPGARRGIETRLYSNRIIPRSESCSAIVWE
jgi:hypothetical protein